MGELYVRYPGTREVILEDVEMGPTNEDILLPPGTYTVALGGPPNYTPHELTVVVRSDARTYADFE